MIAHEFNTDELVMHPAWADLKRRLIGRSGLEYYADRDMEFATRIAQRMSAISVSTPDAYLALLESSGRGDEEFDHLVQDLTVGETHFFRHVEMFDALERHVLPELLERRRSTRMLRIWSAGCSIGAEPYSLAMMLDRRFGRELTGWDVTIIATDINRRFLAQARQGLYKSWALRGLGESQRARYMRACRDGFQLDDRIRSMVRFEYHNLATDAFPSLFNGLCGFDLILCRNVTIYFNNAMIRRCADQFHNCLVDGGWLAIGHAEPNVEVYRNYRSVNFPGAVLYQKSDRPSLPDAVPAPTQTPVDASDGLDTAVGRLHRVRVDLSMSLLPKLTHGGDRPAKAEASGATDSLEPVHALARRGEFSMALARVQVLIEQDRLNPRLHLCASMLLSGLGLIHEMEHALRRVIYLDRSNAAAHYLLGLRRQAVGDMGGAERCYIAAQCAATGIPPDAIVLDIEPMTAGELVRLTERQLEVIRSR